MIPFKISVVSDTGSCFLFFKYLSKHKKITKIIFTEIRVPDKADLKKNLCTSVHLRRKICTPTAAGLRLDRSTARYIYKAKNGKLLVVLTPSQKEKLIFELYIQTIFNKNLFQTIKY